MFQYTSSFAFLFMQSISSMSLCITNHHCYAAVHTRFLYGDATAKKKNSINSVPFGCDRLAGWLASWMCRQRIFQCKISLQREFCSVICVNSFLLNTFGKNRTNNNKFYLFQNTLHMECTEISFCWWFCCCTNANMYVRQACVCVWVCASALLTIWCRNFFVPWKHLWECYTVFQFGDNISLINTTINMRALVVYLNEPETSSGRTPVSFCLVVTLLHCWITFSYFCLFVYCYYHYYWHSITIYCPTNNHGTSKCVVTNI